MLHRHAFLVMLPIIVSFAFAEDAKSKLYEVEEEVYNAYKERLCNVLPFGGGSGELPPWSDRLTLDEVYELALITLGYQLSSDAIEQIPGNLGWKKRIVDLIAYVTQTTCGSPGLSSSYINVAKNLFLYYILKYEKSANATAIPDDDPFTDVEWKEIVEAISQCSRDIEPIPVADHCGMFTNYQDHDGTWIPMPTHLEQFDKEVEPPNGDGIDIVVDNVWWMFSTTYARCYTYFYPNEDIILLFFQRFRDDILMNFASRWRGAGDLVDHFSLIFGPINSYESYENIRLCSGASFEYEGLSGRELIRPVTVTVNNQPVRNFRV